MRIPFKNHTVFAGYVVADVVARTLSDGEAVVSVRIVAKHSYKDSKSANGWSVIEEFATAAFYRKAAEDVIAAKVTKNDFIHVEGRRSTRKASGNGEGVTSRVTHEIVVTDWHLVRLPETGAPQHPEQPARREGAAVKTSKAVVSTAPFKSGEPTNDFLKLS
jgi:single-stranded DNA-binding protein